MRLVQSWIGIIIRAVRFLLITEAAGYYQEREARARRSRGRCNLNSYLLTDSKAACTSTSAVTHSRLVHANRRIAGSVDQT
jgi:hypothetical protein